MAHHNTIKSDSYHSLARRLNKFPQGASPTDYLFRILKVLFSEREAKLVSLLPIKPFSDKKAAGRTRSNALRTIGASVPVP